MNGRNFLDLALLVPGVSPTNTNSTQLFAETSAVPGQGLSIASQRNLSNSFIVDGLSANDDAAGLSGIPFGVDAIEQFQVVTGGGAGGARPGARRLRQRRDEKRHQRAPRHGLRLLSRRCLQRQERPDGTTLPMDQQQFGASLGGPLALNRTFYFANVERKLLDQTGVVSITPANVAAINARLAQVGYQGLPVATGIYPNPVHSLNVLGKIDHQISGADQLSVRYALYDVTSTNARGVGNLNAPSGSTGLDNVDQSLAVGNVWTLSSNTVNETRVQVAHGNLEAFSTDLDWAAGHDRRRGDVRHVLEQPHQPREHPVPDRQQPVASRRRPRAPRRRRLPLQRRHDHLPAHVPRQLHVLVAGELPDQHLQRLRPDVRQSRRQPDEPELRHLRAG